MRYFPILLLFLFLNNFNSAFSQTNKDSLLIEAIKAGKIDEAKKLVEDGADVNAHNSNGESIINMAADQYNKEMAELLLSHGAKTEDIRTYIKVGLENKAIKLLKEQKYSKTYLDSALHLSYNLALWDLFSALIEKGADINSPDQNGNLILHKFILLNNIEKVKALVEIGADINAKDYEGHTALTLARKKDNKELAKFLILNGADKDYKISPKISTCLQLGHLGTILSITYSPDGKYFLSGSNDNTIKLWETKSGKEIKTFSGHFAPVTTVTYTPDGKYFLSGSLDQTIKLWDIESGKEIRTFSGHSDAVNSVTYSPNGKYFLSGSWDQTIKLWDIESGKEIRTFSGHSGFVTAVTYSPNGKNILSGSFDQTIKLWDIESGKEIRTFSGHSDVVYSVSYSPNGKNILSGSIDHTIKLWDIESGKEIRTFSGHSDGVYSVSYSPNGMYFISGSIDRTIKLWDIESDKETRTFSGHSGFVNSVTHSPNGKYFLSGSRDCTIKLWDIESGKQIRIFSGHSGFAESITYSPDGKYFLSGSSDQTIKLWDIESGKEIRTFSGHSNPVTTVTYSPDGKYFLSGSLDHTIKLWDIESGKEIRTFSGHSGFVTAVTYSPNGKNILSGSFDQTIKLWDIESGKEIITFSGHSAPVTTVTYSPGGKYFLSGSLDHTIKLWEVNNSKEIKTFSGHSDGITTVTYSPDNKYLLSGSHDHTIILWNIESGKEIRVFSGYSGIVQYAYFSQDGRYILSAGRNSYIKLWTVKPGKPLVELIALDSTDWAVVTPDGKFDASPNGMKLMYYVKDMKPITLEAFMENYYTPGLLKLVMDGDYVPDEDRGEILFPPEIEILSPDINEVINKDLLQLKVMLTDEGGGIDEIRLYQNGKLIEEKIFGFEPGLVPQIPFNFNISLLPGKNEFKVTAFGSDRTGNTKEFFLELDNKVIPEYSAESDLYIVAIGINKYKNSRYDLKYSQPDAQAFMQAMRKRTGSIFKNIYPYEIYDTDATKTHIDSVLQQIIKKSKPTDTFVFYYAGHGVLLTAEEGMTGDYHLVLHDIMRIYEYEDVLNEKGISSKELKEYCKNIKAQKQLLVLDACQSGSAVKEFAMRGSIEEKAIRQLATNTGSTILASALEHQTAKEYRKLGHGLFTYALLKGLEGEADNGDGKITVFELSAFLDDKVTELTTEFGYPQATIGNRAGQDFPIVIVK